MEVVTAVLPGTDDSIVRVSSDNGLDWAEFRKAADGSLSNWDCAPDFAGDMSEYRLVAKAS